MSQPGNSSSGYSKVLSVCVWWNTSSSTEGVLEFAPQIVRFTICGSAMTGGGEGGGILDYNLTLAAADARIWQSSLIMSDHICIPGKLAEERQMIQAFLSRGKKWKKQIESLFCVIDWTYLKTEHTRVCCVPDSCVIERIRCGEVMLKRLRKGCCSVTFQLNDLLTVNDSWWPEVCFLNSLL